MASGISLVMIKLQKLYHVTKKEKEDSILKHGLIPQIGENSIEVEDAKAVFLFTSFDEMEMGLMNWFLDRFEETDILSILEVEITEDQFELYVGAWEVTVFETIPPEFIKVHKYITGHGVYLE
jgi:RNA:NAD 2'-phosphotransferase (TPT1/KptA family)